MWGKCIKIRGGMERGKRERWPFDLELDSSKEQQ